MGNSIDTDFNDSRALQEALVVENARNVKLVTVTSDVVPSVHVNAIPFVGNDLAEAPLSQGKSYT